MKTKITKLFQLSTSYIIILSMIMLPSFIYALTSDTNSSFSNIPKNEDNKSSEYIVMLNPNLDKSMLNQSISTIESQIKEMNGSINKYFTEFNTFTFNATDKNLPIIKEYLENNSDVVHLEKNMVFGTE